MVAWLITLGIFTILSYLVDMDVLPILREFRVPILNASMLSVLLLICTMAMLGRVLMKIKAKEKERLREKILKLEKELEEFREKYK